MRRKGINKDILFLTLFRSGGAVECVCCYKEDHIIFHEMQERCVRVVQNTKKDLQLH